MTEAELKAEVFTNLGFGTKVQVELEDDHWAAALQNSLRWFNSRLGSEVLAREIPVTSWEYEEHVLPSGTIGVSEVYAGLDYLGQFSFDMPGFVLWQVGHDYRRLGHRFSALVLYLQHSETLGRIAGGYGWEYEPGTRILRTWKLPQTISSLFYDAWVVANKIEDVQAVADIDLIVRRVTARCKQTLGRIRGKYKQYPGPGGPVEMDADKLLDEAAEEIKETDEYILSRASQIPFVTG
jgi:hypothetical protein